MPLVILDRDGVINRDSPDYIKTPEEWQALPGSLEAIARLCRADYRVVVATNQAGIARGLFSQEMLNRIHRKMVTSIREKGGRLESIFFCPHGPDDACSCRKPRPGLFLEISQRLRVPLDGVPAVGDSLRDLEAASSAGAKPILVQTGRGQETRTKLLNSDSSGSLSETQIYPDLKAFTEALLDGALAAFPGARSGECLKL
ncbi:MAG: D-glycero-beta-D-manno-heptose-1,7-bisphosphate 7-phosphatase [Acidiferrobacteraceae bacterium]|nr:D-glycero-beta-D-manno-heptose-1,7-bisphosphate 7-phosphatase [Acidiferrobacteraceae bacterium]